MFLIDDFTKIKFLKLSLVINDKQDSNGG